MDNTTRITISPTNTQNTFTRAVNGITQGETYQVSMRAIDKARNITEASNEPKTVTVKSFQKQVNMPTVEL